MSDAAHPFDPNVSHFPAQEDEALRNLEIEQAILGILLFDNEQTHLLPQSVKAEDFFEPFHQRLYDAIRESVAAGYMADPNTLKEEFRGDGAFEALGGMRYLVDLVDHAPPGSHLKDYCRVLEDLAARRRLIDLSKRYAKLARDTGADDTAKDLVSKFESELLEMQVETRASELVSLNDALAGTMAYVQDLSTATGIETGIRPIDLQLGPGLPGDLVLLAGRPSMGKSAIGLSVALNVAAPKLAAMINGRDPEEFGLQEPGGVIQIHGEMTFGDALTGGQTARRHLCDVGYALFGPDFPKYSDIRKKNVSTAQLDMMAKAMSYLVDVPIFGIKRTGTRLSNVRSLVRRQAAEWRKVGIPLKLVLIDHVGLIRPEHDARGRYDAQTEIAIGTKELAGELGVPIWALVQLNRNVESREDKRPQLSDLRESGAWEENADAVLMAYRDAYYAQREPEPDASKILEWDAWDRRRKSKDVDVLMPKVREGDAGGTAKVWADLPWNAIRGIEPQERGLLI